MNVPLSWIVGLLALTNLLAFIGQAVDKRRAQRRQWRIPERTLLLLGLPLAAPGMFCGMFLLRHKTRKPGFLALAMLVALANAALAAAALWAWSRGLLKPT